jgi:hypothetical protein
MDQGDEEGAGCLDVVGGVVGEGDCVSHLNGHRWIATSMSSSCRHARNAI